MLTYTVAEFLSVKSARRPLNTRAIITNVIEMIRTTKTTTTPMAVISIVKGNESSGISELGGEVTTELGLGVAVDFMMSGLMIQSSSVMLKLSMLPVKREII